MSKQSGKVVTNWKGKSQVPSLEAVPTKGFVNPILPAVIFKDFRATPSCPPQEGQSAASTNKS